MFLKVGDLIFNPSQIVSVDLAEVRNEEEFGGGHVDRVYVSITTTALGGEFGHGYAGCGSLNSYVHRFPKDSDEAKAIVKYFTNPQHSINLLPSEEEEAFQSYRDRGGQLPFEEWAVKHQQLKELVRKSGDWSDRHLDRVTKLEQELLY